jgi:pyruvate dehydrogenase E1 component beta subunit
MVSRALAAAEELAESRIEATVVDPRTLKPLDEATILERVRATGRALLVQEAPRTAGFTAEISARIAESDTLYHLLAPVRRLSGLDAPIPYNPDLEKASVPQVPDIVQAARALMEDG